MKQKVIFPIAFSLLLSSFTAYSVLDTLVLESTDVIEVDDDEGEDFKFPTKTEDDNKDDPKDKPEDNPEQKDPGKTPEDKPEDEPGNKPEEKKDKSNVVGDVYTEGETYDGVNPNPNGDYLYKYETEDLNIKIFKETIKTHHMTEDRMMDTIVFCAEVKISDCSHFRTRFAKAKGATKPTFGMNITNKTSEIAVDGGAIFAINGDYYGAREKGYVVRNGKTYRDFGYNTDREDLVVWGDGRFGIFNEEQTKLNAITDDEKGAWQVFSFGPALVIDNKVNVEEDAEVSTFSTLGNQRCSIGVYEPLHYFIAICEGRLKDSYGMSLYEMAGFMAQKGVKTAYNLDGGGSATMWYDGKVLNRPNTNGDNDIKERKISDIIFFK